MSRTILIVEDDTPIRENLREILEMEEFDVIEAKHGKEALDALYDLTAKKATLPFGILLDLNMPVMSGREFLALYAASGETFAKIPVIVMTAVADAKNMGTYAFLRKPIDIDQLIEMLNTLAKHA